MSRPIEILSYFYATLKPMAKKKRPFLLLLLSIICLASLGYFIYTYHPKTIFPDPIPLSLQPIYIFFLLVFLTAALFAAYIGNTIRRGIFFGLFLCAYLLLRLNQFSEIYFALILFALYISLELFFSRYR